MKPPYDHAGEIIKINASLCWAVFLVCAAIWIWPSDPHWYAFYGLSVVLCLAASGLVFNSLRTMLKLKKTRDRWNEIQKLGNAPKNARLASKHELQSGGMN